MFLLCESRGFTQTNLIIQKIIFITYFPGLQLTRQLRSTTNKMASTRDRYPRSMSKSKLHSFELPNQVKKLSRSPKLERSDTVKSNSSSRCETSFTICPPDTG